MAGVAQHATRRGARMRAVLDQHFAVNDRAVHAIRERVFALLGYELVEGAVGQTAIREVNLRCKLDLPEGEVVTVLGPSGSGKSTLLSLVGGLSRPTSGTVLVDSIDLGALGPNRLSDFRREYLGFVFQSFYLVPYLTALENVVLPLTVQPGMNGKARSAALEALGLWARLEPRAVYGDNVRGALRIAESGNADLALVARSLVGDGGNAGGNAIVPNLFFAMDLSRAWSIGLGINVPFGLKTEYDSDWIGRFQGIESEVKTLNINPSVSFKVSDRVSAGFGVSYQRAEIDLLSAVNYSGIAFALVGAGVEGRNTVSVDGEANAMPLEGIVARNGHVVIHLGRDIRHHRRITIDAVRVRVDPNRLSQIGIGLEEVRAALGRVNANKPKGELSAGETLGLLGNSAMQVASAAAEKPRVGDVLDERVMEGKGGLAVLARSIEKARGHELGGDRRRIRELCYRLEQREPDAAPDHRRRLEETRGRAVEQVDARGQDTLDRRRDRALVPAGSNSPSSVVPLEGPAVLERSNQLLDEQRVSCAAARDEG